MDGLGPGVRKFGVYKKLKTSKKKFFILRDNTSDYPACLEYYDSEKKCKPGTKPKKSVDLINCFGISAKQDAKHEYVILLFTRDDCLGIVFDIKEEQQEWLDIMLALQHEAGVPDNQYEHVWQATIKPQGLANGKVLSAGVYRLCLTKKSLFFIRLHKDEPDIEFQLPTIRRCGHTKTFFFVECGNGAPTGEGELWMQVEDSVIAHNMHDILLKAMKAYGEVKPRGRSHTMDKALKPSSANSGSKKKRHPSVGESSTLPRKYKARSVVVPPTTEEPPSPGRLRHSNSPIKSVGNHTVRPKSSFVTARDAANFSVSPAHSPLTPSPLSVEMRCRADSMESHGSRRTDASSVSDELEIEQVISGGSGLQSEPDYLAMSTIPKPKDITIKLSPEQESKDYMEMKSHTRIPSRSTTNDPYIQMSPVQSNIDCEYLEMGGGISPCVSTASSGIGTEDSSYLDMSVIGSTLNDIKEKLDDGYLDMHTSCSSFTKASSEGLRPDKVPSLLSDTESIDEFPKRAYSVGSKPVPAPPGLSESYAYMDMSTSKDDKGKQKASSAPHLAEETVDGASLLGLPGNTTNWGSQSSSRGTTPRSGTPSQTMDYDQQDLFMEMDFQSNKSGGSHESLTESRSRTSSFGSKDFRSRTSSGGSKDFRSRTSSGGSKDFHSRTSSFGNDFRERTDSAGSRDSKHNRALHESFRTRTQTICQDSIRPRTSSFGTADNMRPRSSSHGNSRFKDLSRRLKEKTLQHRFHDQNKKASKLASTKENVPSQHNSAVELEESDYIDIEVKKEKHGIPSSQKKTVQRKISEPKNVDEDYMIIKPVQMCSELDPTSHHTKSIKHVHISPKIETIIDSRGGQSSSPRIKRSSFGRHDAVSTGHFKHSSSSESVSSTSSCGDYNSKVRSRKTSTQSLTSSSDYFEVVPPVTTTNQTSPRYPHISSSKLIRRNSKPEMPPDDTYLLFAPTSGQSENSSYSADTSEKVSSPSNEDSHTVTFLALDKIVSPIREEDNEAIFGPKPKTTSSKAQKLLKHEYVNVKFDGTKDGRNKQSDECKKDVVVEKMKGQRLKVKKSQEPYDNKTALSQSSDNSILQSNVSADKTSIKPVVSAASIKPVVSAASIKPVGGNILTRVEHEYCEVSFDNESDRVNETKLVKPKSSILSHDNTESNLHEINYSHVKKTTSSSYVTNKMTLNISVEDSKLSSSPSTPAPFDVSHAGIFIKDQKEQTADKKMSLSPKDIPAGNKSPSIDVFNLGAKPSSMESTSPIDITSRKLSNSADSSTSPIDIKARKLSSSPSSDCSSSSQVTTICNEGIRSLGSVTSLPSLDNLSTKLRSQDSNGGQNSMNNPGDRRSYQEQLTSTAGDQTITNLCCRQLSRSSVSSVESQSPMLNYATLDLSGSLEESGFPSVPQISPGIKTSMQPGLSSEVNSKPISYAQIDFEKSEQIKNSSSVSSKGLNSKNQEEN